MSKSSSYTKSWGEDCFLLGDKPSEPCWGEVLMVYDGIYIEDGNIHETNATYTCEGHADWPNGPYIPEKEAEK